MTLLKEFTDDEGERSVLYGISRAQWAEFVPVLGWNLGLFL